MKKQGHPAYQDILFIDSSTGHKFICGSTLQPKEKEMFEGKEYPVYRLAVSSSSHPFFTKSQQFVDSEGRVDKFKKRYTLAKTQQQEKDQKEKEQKLAQKEAAKKGKKK